MRGSKKRQAKLRQQGIVIKAKGLTDKERKIIKKALREINYGRKKDKRQSLPYLMKLK